MTTIDRIISDRRIIRALDDAQLEVLKCVLAEVFAPTLEVPTEIEPALPAARAAVAPDADGIYRVHVDGSCSGNPGPGAWAAAFSTGAELIGGEDQTTNNRMEIVAAAEAIAATPQGSHLIVYTDSQLVVKTMSGEYRKKTNTDLWERLEQARRQRARQCSRSRRDDAPQGPHRPPGRLTRPTRRTIMQLQIIEAAPQSSDCGLAASGRASVEGRERSFYTEDPVVASRVLACPAGRSLEVKAVTDLEDDLILVAA
jgi:hypothetical protein